MTEKEAIEILADFDLQVAAKADGAYQSTIGKMACDIAIQALEEIQQYREIGTVEELKKVDAVIIKRNKTISRMIDECMEYERIGTVEECRTAVEKQKAKKPDYEGDGYGNNGVLIYDTWICPCCGENYELDYDDYEHCPKCGQEIDWSEEDEIKSQESRGL